MDAERLKRFSDAYLDGLTKAVTENPGAYAFPLSVVPVVHARMMTAVAANEFNHDGEGFKHACAALGIKHTRTAILRFLAGL